MTLPATVMAQLSQACNHMTAQDTSNSSELVTGVDSYARELQEKTELVTGIRYAHIIGCNQVIASKQCEQYFPTQCGQWLASEDKN